MLVTQGRKGAGLWEVTPGSGELWGLPAVRPKEGLEDLEGTHKMPLVCGSAETAVAHCPRSPQSLSGLSAGERHPAWRDQHSRTRLKPRGRHRRGGRSARSSAGAAASGLSCVQARGELVVGETEEASGTDACLRCLHLHPDKSKAVGPPLGESLKPPYSNLFLLWLLSLPQGLSIYLVS